MNKEKASQNKKIGMICNICGFFTTDPEDMIAHLAQAQRYDAEECNLKIISFDLKEK